jgi:hypothetical protein
MQAFPEKKPDEGFVPVNVTIKFENQDELDVFGALFNVGYVVEAVERRAPTFKAAAIRRAVQNVGGDTSRLHDALRDTLLGVHH